MYWRIIMKRTDEQTRANELDRFGIQSTILIIYLYIYIYAYSYMLYLYMLDATSRTTTTQFVDRKILNGVTEPVAVR